QATRQTAPARRRPILTFGRFDVLTFQRSDVWTFLRRRAGPMVDKLWFLIPEMILFGGVVVVSIMGLSPLKRLRDALPLATAAFLGAACIAVPLVYTEARVAEADSLMPWIGMYMKPVIYGIGILLAMLCA